MILCGSCILKRCFRVRFFFNISSETTGTITDLKTGSNVVFTPLLPKTNGFCKETHFGVAIHGFVWFVHWLFMIWHAIHGCNCPFIGASIRFSSPRDLGNVFLKEGIRFRKRADEELSSRWIQITLDTIWDFCNFGQLFCYFALKIYHFSLLRVFGPFFELQIVSEGLEHRKIVFPTCFYCTSPLWPIKLVKNVW